MRLEVEIWVLVEDFLRSTQKSANAGDKKKRLRKWKVRRLCLMRAIVLVRLDSRWYIAHPSPCNLLIPYVVVRLESCGFSERGKHGNHSVFVVVRRAFDRSLSGTLSVMKTMCNSLDISIH